MPNICFIHLFLWDTLRSETNVIKDKPFQLVYLCYEHRRRNRGARAPSTFEKFGQSAPLKLTVLPFFANLQTKMYLKIVSCYMNEKKQLHEQVSHPFTATLGSPEAVSVSFQKIFEDAPQNLRPPLL